METEPIDIPAPDSLGTGAAPADADGPALARKLGLFDITMLVMGSIIGVGIFAVPHTVAGLVRTPTLVLTAWVFGGVVTLAGSLVYAELTRRRPQVGGQYAFLREAYHPAVAFMYGWSLLWIVQSGGMASVAVVFGDYFLVLARLFADWLGHDGGLRTLMDAPAASNLISAVAIGTLTAINCAGVRTGSTAQNIFMILKILAIGMLVLCGLLFVTARWSLFGGIPDPSNRSDAVPGSFLLGDWQGMTIFAAALVPVLFSYGGSHTTTFMAGEVYNPRRNLPRGLVLGVSGVIVLYLAVNYVCLRVLGIEELMATESPAAEVMRRALGGTGAVVISAGIAISALGFLSQATLTSPRVYYAMARHGLFFRAVAWVHPRTRVPVVAILLQGAFAIVIAVSGSFHQIVNYVMSVEMVFLSLTAMSLFIIRRRDAAAGVTEATGWGHPITTLLFAAVNIALVLDLFYKYPMNSALGIGIALAGLPAYFLWRGLLAPK